MPSYVSAFWQREFGSLVSCSGHVTNPAKLLGLEVEFDAPFLPALLLLAPLPGYAQSLSPLSPEANARMPQCGPAMDGQTMCRFGVIYECELTSPASMERRTGWRWKMDVLRACDTAAAPADLPGDGRKGLPPDFTYAPQTNGQNTQPGQTGLRNQGQSGRR